MDCIVWAAHEFNNHYDLICKEELWYESNASSAVTSQRAEALWKRHEIKHITMADLEPLTPHDSEEMSDSTIHPGFTAQLRSRRLARKRKMRRYVLNSDSSTDEDERVVAPNIVFPTDTNDFDPSIDADDNEIGQEELNMEPCNADLRNDNIASSPESH